MLPKCVQKRMKEEAVAEHLFQRGVHHPLLVFLGAKKINKVAVGEEPWLEYSMRREEDLDKEQVEGEEYTVMGNKICWFEVVGVSMIVGSGAPRKVQPCPDEEEGGVNWSLDCR